jgi:exosortase
MRGPEQKHQLVGLFGLGGILLWSYWPVFRDIQDRWATDPIYSHGYLVPAFALALLWLRWKPNTSLAPSWWGLVFLSIAASMRLAGAYFYFDWIGAASLLPCLCGICLCLGGWAAFRWAWPAIGFLVFMLPLPYRLETGLAQPLRGLATRASTYSLQTLGFPAVAEANKITISGQPIEVEAECNGLGMLVTFFAMSTAFAIVIRRHWIDKLVILASALPIALLANVIRITVIGIMSELVGMEFADFWFHQNGGWLMMPLALGMLGLELWILSRLLVQPPEQEPMAFAFAAPSGRNRSVPIREMKAPKVSLGVK